MFKKGEIGWEEISKILIVILFLIIIIAIAILFKDKLYKLVEEIKTLVRFGS
jgi:hypothetical protein